MSKLSTIFTLVLLLSFTLTFASRPNLGFKGVSSLHEDVVVNKALSEELDDESCEGEEECLTRRTLAAHIDYIYTQNKPKN
ncbi:phytosulfokines-like [Cicer arietinum]|uniref:Phytosulfokine n=1 Tax=Cicer arietinum TaxID=3827 RepID=A0A1S2Y5S4_CICAR|nr:phytosulfokines-like [Cicer arietinum]